MVVVRIVGRDCRRVVAVVSRRRNGKFSRKVKALNCELCVAHGTGAMWGGLLLCQLPR